MPGVVAWFMNKVAGPHVFLVEHKKNRADVPSVIITHVNPRSIAVRVGGANPLSQRSRVRLRRWDNEKETNWKDQKYKTKRGFWNFSEGTCLVPGFVLNCKSTGPSCPFSHASDGKRLGSFHDPAITEQQINSTFQIFILLWEILHCSQNCTSKFTINKNI